MNNRKESGSKETHSLSSRLHTMIVNIRSRRVGFIALCFHCFTLHMFAVKTQGLKEFTDKVVHYRYKGEQLREY